MDTPSEFPTQDGGVWVPRISPLAYVVVQFLFLGLAAVSALARTWLRVKKFRRVTLDDAALLLALALLCASVGITYDVSDEAYLTTAGNLGLISPNAIPNYALMIQHFEIMDDAANVVSWGAIYTVKLSFVLFLRQLVARVRNLRIYWWVVFAIVAASTPIAMFLGFYICDDFSINLTRTCGPTVVFKQEVFLIVNCTLDILTDSLILTIPIALLWKVQISLRRKLALATVLCLSAFMIVIAVLRVALDQISVPGGRSAPDTPWLYFWTNVEGAVAIIMVSLTAFRSMLGQSGHSSGSSGKGRYHHQLHEGSGERHALANAAPPAGRRSPSGGDAESEIRKEITINQHVTTRSISKPIPLDDKDIWHSQIHDSPV